MITGVIGAVLGTVLGLALGAALADAFTRSQHATVTIPPTRIAVYIVATAAAGVLAAIAPARRAARLNVLDAIAAERAHFAGDVSRPRGIGLARAQRRRPRGGRPVSSAPRRGGPCRGEIRP